MRVQILVFPSGCTPSPRVHLPPKTDRLLPKAAFDTWLLGGYPHPNQLDYRQPPIIRNFWESELAAVQVANRMCCRLSLPVIIAASAMMASARPYDSAEVGVAYLVPSQGLFGGLKALTL